MKQGFDCLDTINLEKKLIMGNHDINDGINKDCSILKVQLKLPWYDIKFPFDFENHYIYTNSEELSQRSYKIVKFIYLDTTIYSFIKDKKKVKK
jgi:hypothetical protein